MKKDANEEQDTQNASIVKNLIPRQTTSLSLVKINDESKLESKEAVEEKALIAPNQLQKEETLAEGGIKNAVFKHYIRGFHPVRFVYGLTLCLLTYATMLFNDRWFAYWISSRNDADSDFNELKLVVIYIAGSVCYAGGLIYGSNVWAKGGVRSSQTLHDDCMKRLMHAPVSWFEENPSGRILSRFSSDLSLVDQTLTPFLDTYCQFTCTLLAFAVLVCAVMPYMLLIFGCAVGFYAVEVKVVNNLNREMRRLSNNAMSPLQSCMSEVVDGIRYCSNSQHQYRKIKINLLQVGLLFVLQIVEIS